MSPQQSSSTASNEHGCWLLAGLEEGAYLVSPGLAGLNFVPNVAETIINRHNRLDHHDFLGVTAEQPPRRSNPADAD